MCLQPVSCKIDGHHNGHHTHDDVDQGPEELDFVWYDFSRLFPVTHWGIEGYACQVMVNKSLMAQKRIVVIIRKHAWRATTLWQQTS